MEARPAVKKGLELLADKRKPPAPLDPKTREILYGAKQYERR